MGIQNKKPFLFAAVFLVFVAVGFWFFNRADDKIPDNVPEVDWRLLGELDIVTGAPAPESLKKYNHQLVKIPGFMVPLEDNMKKVKQFLLVPSPQACIHVPPPPPNQMVLVDMEADHEVEVEFGPIWIYGTFEIQDHKHMYGTSSFGMKGLKTELYR